MKNDLKNNQIVIPKPQILSKFTTAELVEELYKRGDENVDKFVAEYSIASLFFIKRQEFREPVLEGGKEKFEEVLKKLNEIAVEEIEKNIG
ncbi:hypothetical protein [Fusobacterium ulcerans]|uniref:hypothetical protein n=1 Tax=Fusobacterium ulcerans TaxID=861 RepID=UPI0027BA9048|nr:hypothetical protein [Fusobacterium ulcerans]